VDVARGADWVRIVDLIELNHVYESGDKARFIFSVWVFRDWYPSREFFEVIDWRWAYRGDEKHKPSAPWRNPRNGHYVVRLKHTLRVSFSSLAQPTDRISVRVESLIFRETWTQFDAERVERRRDFRRPGLFSVRP